MKWSEHFAPPPVRQLPPLVTDHQGWKGEMIFNEPEHEEVFADLLAWCEDRL